MVQRDLSTAREHDGVLDGVGELPDVAGETIGRQGGIGVGRKHGQDVLARAVELGKPVEKELDQHREISLALAQRRQAQVENVDAVEEILAEQSLRHLLAQIAMRRRNHAHVDLDGASVPPCLASSHDTPSRSAPSWAAAPSPPSPAAGPRAAWPSRRAAAKALPVGSKRPEFLRPDRRWRQVVHADGVAVAAVRGSDG